MKVLVSVLTALVVSFSSASLATESCYRSLFQDHGLQITDGEEQSAEDLAYWKSEGRSALIIPKIVTYKVNGRPVSSKTLFYKLQTMPVGDNKEISVFIDVNGNIGCSFNRY